METDLTSLPNIGATVAEQLVLVGITNSEELRAVGAKAAWTKIQSIDPSACIHRLQALEGAIRGVKKSSLPVEVKEDLRQYYKTHKIQ